ncbi:hypothetical protein NXH76_23850 [Blautia schinkii]|nr:hypothetical protein [Blautia schinkii]
MSVSTRDKKILLMFLGVLLLVLSYFFVYKGQMEEASVIESENVSLQARLNELLEMAKNKEFYEQETREMQTKILEYCEAFPADVRPEDGIVLAQNMENVMDMKISNVGLGAKEFIASLDGKTEEERGEDFEQTLMEQGASVTEEQIAEIEQTQGISREEAIQQQSMEIALDATTDLLNAAFTPTLYRTQDTIQFVSTYDSLKRSVKYLASQDGRMTMNNVNASFDSTTGNLTGTMTINIFSMTGAANTYNKPDAGKVPYGTDNIFGTIESTTKKKKSKKQKAAAENKQEAQTTENQENNEQGNAAQDGQKQEGGEAQ